MKTGAVSLCTLVLLVLATPAAGGLLDPGGDLDELVVARDLTLAGGEVSGTLENRSAKTLSNVKLLVNYVWMWADERHPGTDNPGRSDYYTVPGEIAPGGTLAFRHAPSPPLPSGRTDGRFKPDVKVVGLTEMSD